MQKFVKTLINMKLYSPTSSKQNQKNNQELSEMWQIKLKISWSSIILFNSINLKRFN